MGDGRLPIFDTGDDGRLVTIGSNLPERTTNVPPAAYFLHRRT
jgi:hypothetical protein